MSSAIFLLNGRTVAATAFELIAPSETLTRGQEVQFTINIDTEGASVSSTQVGLTYDTQYLQYVSSVPGETMNSVTVTDLGSGKILLSGVNSGGYNGSGVFATVTFTLIATSAGETTLCTLWAPTPTTATTTTATTAVPTQLPVSGAITKTYFGLGAGALLLLAAGANLVLGKKRSYKPRQ